MFSLHNSIKYSFKSSLEVAGSVAHSRHDTHYSPWSGFPYYKKSLGGYPSLPPGDMLEKNISFYTRLITVFMTVSFGENMLMFFFINGYI